MSNVLDLPLDRQMTPPSARYGSFRVHSVQRHHSIPTILQCTDRDRPLLKLGQFDTMQKPYVAEADHSRLERGGTI